MHIQTANCIQHDHAVCAVGLCGLNSAMADYTGSPKNDNDVPVAVYNFNTQKFIAEMLLSEYAIKW